jgi:hypothetical protein
MRSRNLLVILLTTAAATLIAAGAANALTASYRAGALTATFTASTHYPNCKQLWPVTVTARYNGKPAHATAYYQFLVGGQLVGTQYPFSGTSKNPHAHIWRFYSSFYDNTFGPFGALAEGHRLTVRAVVQVAGIRAYPGTWVRVQKANGCPAR